MDIGRSVETARSVVKYFHVSVNMQYSAQTCCVFKTFWAGSAGSQVVIRPGISLITLTERLRASWKWASFLSGMSEKQPAETLHSHMATHGWHHFPVSEWHRCSLHRWKETWIPVQTAAVISERGMYRNNKTFGEVALLLGDFSPSHIQDVLN